MSQAAQALPPGAGLAIVTPQHVRGTDKPVLVRLTGESEARLVGFVTQESLDRLGLPGYASVYFPQSYNFAGNLVVFPSSQLEPLDAASADVMAFIVSGGVTDVPVTRVSRERIG